MNLTRFGVWTSYHAIGVENSAQAARLAQDLGYGAFWLGGSPEGDELRPLLEATETLVAATGIVAAEAAAIERDCGDRSLIGIGAGHPEATSEYTRPRHATIEFLDVLDAAPAPLPRERRILAALGPKMLDLAGERSLGSHPYFTNVEHTAFARDRL